MESPGYYDEARIDEAMVRRGVDALRRFHPEASVVVLTDVPRCTGPVPGWPVVAYEGKEQIARAVDEWVAPGRLFFLVFDSDQKALATVRAIRGRGARWFPIKQGVIARYWHLDDRVRRVLRDELAWQHAQGFLKWDDADFSNLIQGIDLTRELPGAFVEIGAFRGSSGSLALRYMKEIGLARDCYFLDVFDGFVYEEARTSPDAAWAGTHATEGREEIERRLRRHESPGNGPRVTVALANVIHDELPEGTERIALANIDVDLYDAVRAALVRVAPRLVPGGLMIVEDPGHTPHLIGARLALEEFLEADGGRDFRRLHMESGQAFVFRREAGAAAHAIVAAPASAGRSSGQPAPTSEHAGPLHAVVCGAIRNPEELRYLLRRLVDWRRDGRAAGIVVSTWYGELERYPSLARDVARAGIELVEGREVTGAGLRNLWRQQRALEQGLGAVPAVARVLKLRTDKCARRLARFERWLERPLDAVVSGSPAGVFAHRLVLSRASATLPGLVDDTAFLGTRDDVARLCHYDARPEAVWPNPTGAGANLLWIGPILARRWSLLESFYRRFDAAGASALVLALAGKERLDALPWGLRRVLGAWWRFLDASTCLARDPGAAGPASLASLLGAAAQEGLVAQPAAVPAQVILERARGLDAAAREITGAGGAEEDRPLDACEAAEIEALLVEAGRTPERGPRSTRLDARDGAFPESLLEPEDAGAPWAAILERALAAGFEKDRPLAAILFETAGDLEERGFAQKAEECRERAAALKHPGAILSRGRRLIEGGSPAEGLRTLLWNLEKRHPETLRYLAGAFLSGRHLPRDPARAWRLLRDAGPV